MTTYRPREALRDVGVWLRWLAAVWPCFFALVLAYWITAEQAVCGQQYASPWLPVAYVSYLPAGVVAYALAFIRRSA